jgi:acylaminoacyl-peptidase
VQDTHHVALKLLETDKFDMNRTMITGGSHGGFTAAILIGQYPDFYKACVLRNPVMNIGTMAASTDIPDWCFAECDISYSFTQPTVITPSNYTKMYACSPMAVAHNVTTPTLLMLGVNDRRVPPTQGLEWFHYQRSRNLDVQCRMYPDNGHALDTLDAEHFGYTHLSTFLLDHTH